MGIMSRSSERILEEAHLSGYLKLNSRKFREFPSSDKYDLNDTVFADLSRNRFTEVPSEITRYWCLEHLDLHHNSIKFIPDSITYLQSLVYLDLCHNQLTSIPSSVFCLPLEILLASNNKLQNLPAEIGYCKTLTELNVSCNQINRLPPQLGVLNSLRSFNVRSNLLLEIPIELTYLKLTRLDMSRNRIASLPIELKSMSSSLEILRLSDNPLMSPPAVVCGRGMIHVFKWLEMRSSKQDKKLLNYNQSCEMKTAKSRNNDVSKNLVDGHHIDWSYLNIDPPMRIYLSTDDKLNSGRSYEKRNSDSDVTDRNISKHSPFKSLDLPSASRLSRKNSSKDSKYDEKGHLQTYKEYKESLRLQRTVDSIYKCPPKDTVVTSKCIVPTVKDMKEHVSPTCKTKLDISSTNTAQQSPIPKVMTTGLKEKETKSEIVGNRDDPVILVCNMKNGIARTKPRMSSDNFGKCQFTMRREYEKAKEEAELIKQLRMTIETRLKVVLPNDLSTALNDGVVLCHFANHVMPQSVGSIHVPSPTVPKLTTARSRRNVDNFLEACRKIGMDEELLCNGNDLLEMKEDYLPTVAVILQNFLSKSVEHNLNTPERINNQTLAPNQILNNASLSSLSMSDQKSTALFVLIFLSINLLLYICPIPDW